MCHDLETFVIPRKIGYRQPTPSCLEVCTPPYTHNYFTKQNPQPRPPPLPPENLIRNIPKMAGIPRQGCCNEFTECLFVPRQQLWIRLEKRAVTQLPPGHKALVFIQEIQPVFSGLMEIYPLILNSYTAKNNNEPTWTSQDKEWYVLKSYQRIWRVIEKFFMKCFLIASDGDADVADETGEEFMTSDVSECSFGYNFFEAMVTNDGYVDIIDFLDDVEFRCNVYKLLLGSRQRLRDFLL